jgi:RNA-splicing ligase RtcB
MFHNYAICGNDTLDEQLKVIRESEAYREQDIAIMPDAHAGKSSCVGFTSTYDDKIIPATVGVDIACRVSLFRIDGEINLDVLDKAIHEHVPSGNSIRQYEPIESQQFPYKELRCWDGIKDGEERYRKSMGTLGSGNHAIWVEGNNNIYYLGVHCGSRNLGLRVANYYQELAITARDARKKEIYDRYEQMIAEKREKGYFDAIQQLIEIRKTEIAAEPIDDLCYIEGQNMEDYLHDMDMLRKWSYLNHCTIASFIAMVTGWSYPEGISSIHNYVDTEHKIIRKGAIAAYKGELGIIPLNMRDGSLIVRGKGNPDWNCSLPHGAGRILSRGEARRNLDLADYEKSMEGIYTTSVCSSTIDEAPDAYKPAELIEQAIGDNAEIIEHIYPIYNFKAKN